MISCIKLILIFVLFCGALPTEAIKRRRKLQNKKSSAGAYGNVVSSDNLLVVNGQDFTIKGADPTNQGQAVTIKGTGPTNQATFVKGTPSSGQNYLLDNQQAVGIINGQNFIVNNGQAVAVIPGNLHYAIIDGKVVQGNLVTGSDGRQYLVTGGGGRKGGKSMYAYALYQGMCCSSGFKILSGFAFPKLF